MGKCFEDIQMNQIRGFRRSDEKSKTRQANILEGTKIFQERKCFTL